MLIVRQNGNVVMNLNNISCIEINKVCPVDLIAAVSRNLVKGERYPGMANNDDFHRFFLGTFESKERTKKVLSDLIDAYERGAKVFRIPEC